jgi:hypothetical protein
MVYLGAVASITNPGALNKTILKSWFTGSAASPALQVKELFA